MKYSGKFIRELTDKINLVELASKDTKLSRQGNIYIGKCPHPDHDDSDPSFRIWYKNNKYTWCCFGCHSGRKNLSKGLYGSDSLAYIHWMLNSNGKKASFEMAINEACKITGLCPESNERQYLDNCSEEAENYFQNLRNNIDAKKYLVSRGLGKEEILSWNIGYDTKGRITFPIKDLFGNTTGFSKRAIDDNNPLKYWVTSDNDYFRKKWCLYGSDKLDYNYDEIYITEGVFDVILAHKYGLKNVVCNCGTDFDDTHAKMISDIGLLPVLVYDGDKAGLKGIDRTITSLAKYNIFPRIVMLDNKLDLANIAEREKYKLKNYIEENTSSYSYYVLKDMYDELRKVHNNITSKYKNNIALARESVKEDKNAKTILDAELLNTLGLKYE